MVAKSTRTSKIVCLLLTFVVVACAVLALSFRSEAGAETRIFNVYVGSEAQCLAFAEALKGYTASMAGGSIGTWTPFDPAAASGTPGAALPFSFADGVLTVTVSGTAETGGSITFSDGSTLPLIWAVS